MMKRSLIFIVLAFLSVPLFESCKQSVATSARNADEPEVPCLTEKPEVLPVLYQQTAAEYRALCYQAFNVAQYQLDQNIRETKSAKKLSVVVDLDETMLDNSPYEAKCILDDVSYPEGWDEWIKKASAKAVPGALEFLLNARAKGVEVFYVSNRKEKYFNETLQNLQKLGFPFAMGDHLFLRRDEKSKKSRRELVERNTSIVMLIGDNLADFSEVFETQNIEERLAITDRFRDKFGTRFIVLPNAIYGDWLDAIYGDDPEATPEARAGLRKQALKIE